MRRASSALGVVAREPVRAPLIEGAVGDALAGRAHEPDQEMYIVEREKSEPSKSFLIHNITSSDFIKACAIIFLTPIFENRKSL